MATLTATAASEAIADVDFQPASNLPRFPVESTMPISVDWRPTLPGQRFSEWKMEQGAPSAGARSKLSYGRGGPLNKRTNTFGSEFQEVEQ